MTLYEAENGSGYANGQPFPSLGSRDKPAQNADGSTTLYFGRQSPPGKKANWLATAPGRGFFAVIRFHGPTEPALKMPRLDLAKRVATLESQVTGLQEQVRSDRPQRRKDWRRAVEKYAGDADLQSVFADAMKLREADRKRARKSARARSR